MQVHPFSDVQPMHRFLASLLQLTFAALPLVCSGAFGAMPAVPASIEKPAPRAIEPIAVAEILERANADERFVQEIVAEALQPDPVDKLVAPLDALVADIRNLTRTFDRQLGSLPALELESLEGYWSFYDRQLAAWRGELQRITARYSETAAELARRRAAWEATRAAAASSALPEALVGRENAILSEIARAEEALSGRLDRQLELASRGNSLQAAVDSSRNAVRAAAENFNRRLLMIDAPPLSDAWSNRAPAKQVLSALNVQSKIQNDFLAKYYEVNAWKQSALGAAALVLLALLLWVSRRSATLASYELEVPSSTLVLRRPVSSWLVVVLLGILYFDRDAPLIVQQTALFLAPVPVLRLLPRRMYAALGPWPYIVTVLYLLHRLDVLVVGTPLLERLFLLAAGMLTLAAILWFLLRLRKQASASFVVAHPALLRSIGSLFAAAIVVAMIANAVGNVSLAEALTRGVVVSSYMGLVLYAANEVLNAILKLLLAHPTESGLRVATQHTQGLLQSLGWLLNVAAFAVWVVVALSSFRMYQPVAEWVSGVLTHPFELGQISITLGGVLLFLVSVWVSFWLAKMIRIVLQEEVLPKIELPHGASNSIATLTYYAVATIGLIVALSAAGFQPSQLTIVVGALSVGIGFGLQNIVNNFVSGLILMFERPIQPGDVVEVSGTSGTVREIGMRATRLKTAEGADVVVPNGTLLSQNLLNWTLSDKSRRLDVNVGVAYGSDLKRVLEILMNAAIATPGLIASPAPSVTFIGMGASSLNFGVSAWTNDFANWGAIRSNMTVRVYDALTAAGVEIPYPQQDVHLRSISKEVRANLGSTGPRPAG
jgi:potassium-dependent mechanosensitive channel